jgi:hypothetical protein
MAPTSAATQSLPDANLSMKLVGDDGSHVCGGARGADVGTVDLVDFEIHHGHVTEVTVYQSDTYGFDEFWS